MIEISNSECQTFKRCKRKWYLAYYRTLGLQRERQYGARAIGNRVHACLEKFYGGNPDSADVLAGHDYFVEQDVLAYPDQADDILKDADMSRAMLEGYFEWLVDTGADEDLEIVATEAELRADLGDNRILCGKIDLRVRTRHDNNVRFLDHKTVQDFTTPTKVLHLDEQCLTYHLLEWANVEDHSMRATGGIYNMLRKVKRTARAKPPFYERFTVEHTEEEIRSFVARLRGTIDDIVVTRCQLDSGGSHLELCYPSPNRNCSWDCDFLPLCNLMDRPSDKPEEFMIAAYQHVDPYARYDDRDKGEVQ